MKKLLTTTDFVLMLGKDKRVTEDYNFTRSFVKAYNYANLISQPLELGMFVPCVDGKPLAEPKHYQHYLRRGEGISSEAMDKIIEFNKTKERVIFNGHEYNGTVLSAKLYTGMEDVFGEWDKENMEFIFHYETIEELSIYHLLIKEIGL